MRQRTSVFLAAALPIAAAAAAAVAACAASGCRSEPLPAWTEKLPESRFTAVNLRGDRDVFLKSSGDPETAPIVPVGSRAVILRFSESQVDVRISELVYTMYPLDEDFSSSPAAIDVFLDKYFSSSTVPAPAVAEPPELFAEAKLGKVLLGMTKEQVYIALGPPRFIDNDKLPAVNLPRDRIFKSDRWLYTRQIVASLIPQNVTYSFERGKLVSKLP